MPLRNRRAAIAAAALLVLLITTSPAPPPELGPAGPSASLARPAQARPTGTPPLAPRPTVAPPALPPTPTPPAPSPEVAAGQLAGTLDRYLGELVQAGLFQGSVLVAREGQLLLDQGYGYADAARHVPNTPQTRFQLASMSKPFTALAVLQLVARGQLSLADSICAYLDDCPAAWQPITVRQLLNHTSGLPNYTDFASFDATQDQPATPAELAARFRDLPLLFAPGSAYMYENSDYVLLGMIIERVSGMRYAEFLHANIFAPLGMAGTGAEAAEPGAPGWAAGYRLPGEPAPPLEPSTLFSAGGLHATTEDLYRWDQALYADSLLPGPLRDEMWAPGLGGYGFGWKVGDHAGHRRVSHTGLMDGYAGAIARYPDERVTVIVLGNMSGADADGIARYLAELVFAAE